MNHLKELRKLESEVFKKMTDHSQIVIDLFQNAGINLDRDENENPVRRDELGALQYRINILINVFNPALVGDIKILKRLDAMLGLWKSELKRP